MPRALVLPVNLRGVERVVRITPERLRHIRERRPEWFDFITKFMRQVIERPDFIGQRTRSDRRRVEFVGLVGPPRRWLLVAAKFLDDKGEAWVSTAYPVSDLILTRRVRTGTLWEVIGGP